MPVQFGHKDSTGPCNARSRSRGVSGAFRAGEALEEAKRVCVDVFLDGLAERLGFCEACTLGLPRPRQQALCVPVRPSKRSQERGCLAVRRLFLATTTRGGGPCDWSRLHRERRVPCIPQRLFENRVGEEAVRREGERDRKSRVGVAERANLERSKVLQDAGVTRADVLLEQRVALQRAHPKARDAFGRDAALSQERRTLMAALALEVGGPLCKGVVDGVEPLLRVHDAT
mmetsp:Transcript_35002/g.112848  ORF Transcript_35002/g.112848 Transcript_35002/m.112848 type:complete len:230 (+) Transcript_35002:406-1095(+)